MMKFLILIGLVGMLLLAACTTTGQATQTQEVEKGQYTSFAQCLTDKGAKMYGTEWCPHCKDQKKLFGDSFENIDYTDCDKNRDACSDAGVRGYPTWVINGESYAGTQQLYKLSQVSGCSLADQNGDSNL